MFRTNHRWLFAGALVIALASVASANPYEGINDNPSDRLRFAMDPFEKPISHSYALGNAKKQVLQRFGEPIERSFATHETRWIDQTQASHGLKYSDVYFVIGERNDGPNTWIERIEITGNAHVLKYDVQIGSPRARIVSLFSPIEHYATSNPMVVSVPTLETQSSFEETGGVVVGYVPSFDITFEFDEKDCLSKIAIFVAADE